MTRKTAQDRPEAAGAESGQMAGKMAARMAEKMAQCGCCADMMEMMKRCMPAAGGPTGAGDEAGATGEDAGGESAAQG